MKKNSATAPIVLLGILALLSQRGVQGTERELPLKGGERVLFIGNSLTASLPEELNVLFKANALPTFEGYRLQIWNQTLETHWTISRETHPQLIRPQWQTGNRTALRTTEHKPMG